MRTFCLDFFLKSRLCSFYFVCHLYFLINFSFLCYKKKSYFTHVSTKSLLLSITVQFSRIQFELYIFYTRLPLLWMIRPVYRKSDNIFFSYSAYSSFIHHLYNPSTYSTRVQKTTSNQPIVHVSTHWVVEISFLLEILF